MRRYSLAPAAIAIASLVLVACTTVPTYQDAASGRATAVIERYTPLWGPNTLVRGVDNADYEATYPRQVTVYPGRHEVTICHFVPDPFIGVSVFSWVGSVEFEAAPRRTYQVRGARDGVPSPGARLMILDTENGETVAETVVASETSCP